MEIVTLNGTPWTVGLRWDRPARRLPPGHAALRREGRDLDAALDADASAHWRTPLGLQYGFGRAGDAWKRFAPAPALCACLDVPASFLGLFRLPTPDGACLWWLHLRLDGVAAEYGDQAFTTEGDARAALSLLQDISGLTPELHEDTDEAAAWLGARLRNRPLDRIVLARGALANLTTPLSRHTFRRLAALAVICCLVVGAAAGWRHVARQHALAQAEHERQLRLQRKADLESHPEKFFSMAWQDAPLAVDMASACLPAMMSVPLASNGWEFHDAVCDGKSVRVTWQYASGADFVLLPDGARLDEKNPKLARAAQRLAPVGVSRPDGKGTNQGALLTREEATGLLSEITQATGTKLSPLQFAAPERKTVDKMPVTAPWRKCPWELAAIPDLLLTVSAGPDGVSLFHMLSEIPGLTLDAIAFDGNWSIRGTIHAK